MTNPYQTPAAALTATTGQLVPCNGCEQELHISAAMCPKCGASQRTRGYKSKNVAALMAFFLGGFGGHRFYLGQWWGIIYLLTFWTWIPGLIALIEMIVFLVSDQKNWDEKYNEGKPASANEGGGGAVIALFVIIGITVFIAIMGILAAIAIPQYQNYINRTKVTQAIYMVDPIKESYIDYANQYNAFPSSNADLGLESPLSITPDHTVTLTGSGIELTLSDSNSLIDGKTIIFSPELSGSEVYWSCANGTLESRYRPMNCRTQ